MQPVPIEIKHHIRRIVSNSNSSFFWSMYIQPEHKRDGMFTLYAFRRVVDDMIDSNLSHEAKREALSRWEMRIRSLYRNGKTDHPITVALNHYRKRFHFKQLDFMNFLQGMRMDLDGKMQLPSLQTLEEYCMLTNGSISNLALSVFEVDSPHNQQLSRSLGIAFQLTNILRDVYEDLREGRFHIPKEALEDVGIPYETMETIPQHPKFSKACSLLSYKAKQHFQHAEQLISEIGPAQIRPIVSMMKIYRSNLHRIEKQGWSHNNHIPKLSTVNKLWKTAQSYMWHPHKKTG